jgi:hypothetical protein
MIVEYISVVTGKRCIDDDVLFTRRLQFIRGVEPSKLVIVPKKGAPLGAQRVLKIVADTIDTGIGGDAEITFNLDGDLTLPLVDMGLDPETKAKNGDQGISDYSPSFGGLIPADTAKPNYSILDPLNYVGGYPKADNGGNGDPGGKGGGGAKGFGGPVLEIWTKQIDGDGLIIDLRGQEGGDGGPGGTGQRGGDGQAGSVAAPATDATWIGVPNVICKQGPGLGGDGGRGGNAGCGGDGGTGGNGGVFKLFYTSNVNVSKISPMLQGGIGGRAGPAGKPGTGGKAGPSGINVPPCVPALSSADGANGIYCPSDKEGGISKPGENGIDGYSAYFEITDLPQIPELWP